ncbi:MAG: porin family protein [Flavobacteriaceae bacterium]
MKKLITFIVLLCIAQTSFGQLFSKERIRNRENWDKKTLTYGYYLGFNSLDFKFQYNTDDHKDIAVKSAAGFNVGLIGNLRLTDHFDLRFEPGLSFTTRILTYPETYTTTDVDFSSVANNEREVKSTYVYLPLLLKISTKRLNNFKPFLLAGASTAMNLSSNEKSIDDNSSGKFRMTANPTFMELGFGIDFYLPYFKFTPSIRGVFANGNELIEDNDPNSPWTGNINKMQTRGFFINFTVQ